MCIHTIILHIFQACCSFFSWFDFWFLYISGAMPRNWAGFTASPVFSVTSLPFFASVVLALIAAHCVPLEVYILQGLWHVDAEGPSHCFESQTKSGLQRPEDWGSGKDSQLHTKYDMQCCETVEVVCPSLTDGKNDGYSPGVSFCLLRRQYDFIYSPQYILNCLMSKLLHGTPKCSLVKLIDHRLFWTKIQMWF